MTTDQENVNEPDSAEALGMVCAPKGKPHTCSPLAGRYTNSRCELCQAPIVTDEIAKWCVRSNCKTTCLILGGVDDTDTFCFVANTRCG